MARIKSKKTRAAERKAMRTQQPRFLAGTNVCYGSSPQLLVDEDGRCWWVHCETQTIKPGKATR